MVSALTASMMIDSPLIAPSFHAIAEAHIADGQRKERNCYSYPNNIAHNVLPDHVPALAYAARAAGAFSLSGAITETSVTVGWTRIR
jgi:hypothetical protein